MEGFNPTPDPKEQMPPKRIEARVFELLLRRKMLLMIMAVLEDLGAVGCESDR